MTLGNTATPFLETYDVTDGGLPRIWKRSIGCTQCSRVTSGLQPNAAARAKNL